MPAAQKHRLVRSVALGGLTPAVQEQALALVRKAGTVSAGGACRLFDHNNNSNNNNNNNKNNNNTTVWVVVKPTDPGCDLDARQSVQPARLAAALGERAGGAPACSLALGAAISPPPHSGVRVRCCMPRWRPLVADATGCA